MLTGCYRLTQVIGALSTSRKLYCGAEKWPTSTVCIRDEELWASEVGTVLVLKHMCVDVGVGVVC